MSAYQCSDDHVNALVTFGALRRTSYYWQGKRTDFRGNEQRIALILQAQNARSVNYRYAHNVDAQCDDDPIKYEIPAQALALPPVAFIKLCHCYAYQACETDDWQETEAYAIIRAIQHAAMEQLPGYSEAPWGI